MPTINEIAKQKLANDAMTGGTNANDALTHRLNSLLLEQLEEERAEKKDKKDSMERLRMQTRKVIDEAERQKAAEQSACDHRKMDGKTRIRGQRMSGGGYILVCQWCQKEWKKYGNKEAADANGGDVWPPPAHLLPPQTLVGGPDF